MDCYMTIGHTYVCDTLPLGVPHGVERLLVQEADVWAEDVTTLTHMGVTWLQV